MSSIPERLLTATAIAGGVVIAGSTGVDIVTLETGNYNQRLDEIQSKAAADAWLDLSEIGKANLVLRNRVNIDLNSPDAFIVDPNLCSADERKSQLTNSACNTLIGSRGKLKSYRSFLSQTAYGSILNEHNQLSDNIMRKLLVLIGGLTTSLIVVGRSPSQKNQSVLSPS